MSPLWIDPNLGALADALLRTSLQAAGIVCLVLAVQVLLGTRLSPRWSHRLWVDVDLRLALFPLAPLEVATGANPLAWTYPSAARTTPRESHAPPSVAPTTWTSRLLGVWLLGGLVVLARLVFLEARFRGRLRMLLPHRETRLERALARACATTGQRARSAPRPSGLRPRLGHERVPAPDALGPARLRARAGRRGAPPGPPARDVPPAAPRRARQRALVAGTRLVLIPPAGPAGPRPPVHDPREPARLGGPLRLALGAAAFVRRNPDRARRKAGRRQSSTPRFAPVPAARSAAPRPRKENPHDPPLHRPHPPLVGARHPTLAQLLGWLALTGPSSA